MQLRQAFYRLGEHPLLMLLPFAFAILLAGTLIAHIASRVQSDRQASPEPVKLTTSETNSL